MFGLPGGLALFMKIAAAGSSWAHAKSIRFNDGGATDETAIGGQPANIVGVNYAANARTFSCWCRINASAIDCTFFSVAEQTNRPIQIYTVSGLPTVYMGTNQMQYGTAMTSGTWYHLCVTNSAAGASILYVNGTNRANVTAGTTATALDIMFGGRRNSANTGIAWTGACNVAQFSIYDVAFTSGEVTADYNSGVPIDPATHSQSAHLIRAWYCGDGDSGSTMTEIIGGGTANCTMTNMEAGDIESVSP